MSRRLEILVAIATIISAVVAVIALIPAFGQWLSDNTRTTPDVPRLAETVTSTPQLISGVSYEPTSVPQPTVTSKQPTTTPWPIPLALIGRWKVASIISGREPLAAKDTFGRPITTDDEIVFRSDGSCEVSVTKSSYLNHEFELLDKFAPQDQQSFTCKFTRLSSEIINVILGNRYALYALGIEGDTLTLVKQASGSLDQEFFPPDNKAKETLIFNRQP